MYVQMVLDNVTNSVYSNEQVTLGNSSFKQALILSPTASHLYALTHQQVLHISRMIHIYININVTVFLL